MKRLSAKEFDLGPADFDSSCWQKLEKLLSSRLQQLRELNDIRPQNGEEGTASLRGKISMLKEIQDLATPGPVNERPE